MRGLILTTAAVAAAIYLTGCSKKPAQESVSLTDGTLIDGRDGKTYKTVEMPDGNRWMAENLNYKTSRGSWCHNCDKYGRLYDRKTAKTVCPSGWHLPSRLEWDDLAESVGGSSAAGKALKTKHGWNDYKSGYWNDFEGDGSGDGADSYGFSALPGGVRTTEKTCHIDHRSRVDYRDAGDLGMWWTASEEEFERTPKAYARYITREWDNVFNAADNDPRSAFSVRCVQDGNNVEEKEKQRLESLSEYFTDSRDGRIYRAVTIGPNTWMARNLDYTPKGGGSWCYDNQDSNCVKYGRLYDWNTAMDVCPSGWRLPSRSEWDTLGLEAGGEIQIADRRFSDLLTETNVELYGASKKLKTKTGWKHSDYGADNYGFSALPGGNRHIDGSFDHAGDRGAWWTTSKNEIGVPYQRHIFGNIMVEFSYPSASAAAVRCLRERSDIAEWKQKREAELKEKEASRKVEEERIKKLSTYFTDTRDGRKYRAVNIGGKTWMAENLNYPTETDSSWCYENNDSNCDKYGRLYDWNTAKTVCPKGWKLPSREDWDSLGQAVGGEKAPFDEFDMDMNWYGAGKTLKSKSGWNENGNGTNDYGFSALPSGKRYSNGQFYGAGKHGEWWTATENIGYNFINYVGRAGSRNMNYQRNSVRESKQETADALSVRCVADNP